MVDFYGFSCTYIYELYMDPMGISHPLGSWKINHNSSGHTTMMYIYNLDLPVTQMPVTASIITSELGNHYRPLFVTATGVP